MTASPSGERAALTTFTHHTSHEVVVELIAATTSTTGLRVHAERDHGLYPTNVQVADAGMAAIGLLPHDFHGEWNYTVDPNA